jgi:hypothetical protein
VDPTTQSAIGFQILVAQKDKPSGRPDKTQYINRIIAGFRLSRLPGFLPSAAKAFFRVLKLQ